MKVKKLISELSKLDLESRVILSTDQEGNGYAYLDDIDTSSKLGIILYPEYEPLDEDDVFPLTPQDKKRMDEIVRIYKTMNLKTPNSWESQKKKK